ncbi:hypothetical protein TGAM01_v210696 [Trichoderma gamsii]|uniref:Uncharacterized protein n=1 Tax=Trichoderma gamsii TaxID=398673 RepID=A0A2P4Z852_9HYPO|nr:hypothetical protein TGAM01_v210696 [Trichoderma gamsii]PON20465.1 hypothetical protein TGAM01_v210696 [Trichoderma gamsii]
MTYNIIYTCRLQSTSTHFVVENREMGDRKSLHDY